MSGIKFEKISVYTETVFGRKKIDIRYQFARVSIRTRISHLCIMLAYIDMYKFFLFCILVFIIQIYPFIITKNVWAAQEGNLIKCIDFPSVYYLGQENKRYVFPNEAIYFSWYQDFADVITISCDQLGDYPLGGNVTYQPGTRLIKIPSVPTVYAIESGGMLRAIQSETHAKNLYGSEWTKLVDDLPESFFPAYTVGDPLALSGIVPEGTILQASDGSLYRMDFENRAIALKEALAEGFGTVLPHYAQSLATIEEIMDISIHLENLGADQMLLDKLQTIWKMDQSKITNSEPTTNTTTQTETDVTNSLSKHDTYITFSTQATSFSSGTLVAQGASVPDLLICTQTIGLCEKGAYIIYFIDAQSMTGQGTEQIGYVKSTDDGQTWSTRQHISIAKKPNAGAAVDPSIVLLNDGRFRLYFYGSETTEGDPAIISDSHVFYSAISDDGIHFTTESGVRFSKNNITDPEIIYQNNTWYLYYSTGPNTGVATSSDGLTFIDQGELAIQLGGVPGALTDDSITYAYGCKQNGISVSTSTDGISFSLIGTALAFTELCDPSVQKTANGYVMVYKLDGSL